MVRKASSSDTEGGKKRRGRPKKNSNPIPAASTGRRKATKSGTDDDAPDIKRLRLETTTDIFESLRTGIVLALGQGEFGQLGLGESITSRKKPALVARDIAGKKIKKVVAGAMHTVCLTEDHKVYTFGCNDEGSLGRKIEDDSEEYEPGLVSGEIENVKVIDISAGDSHTAALSDTGIVYLWGCFRDNRGKLGLVEESKISLSPVKLDMPNQKVMRIASGVDHVVMLTDDGKVLTIGCGEQGQLGRISRYFLDRGGRRTLELLSARQPRIPRVKGKRGNPIVSDVYCGSYSTYVISAEGDVFAFGLNNYNQLGIPDEETRYMPTHIPVLSRKKWKMISAGLHHSLLLDEKGDVYSLGRGEYGRLGLGEDITLANKPTKIDGLKDIVHIATGPCVSFAVARDGKAYGWGMGTNLQLTTGEEDDEWTPVALSGKNLEERFVIAVSGGGQHTVLLACDKSEMANGQGSS